MNEKYVTLIRKQATPYVVNYPMNDGRIRKYEWLGTRGKILDKKQVPREVYEWLLTYTYALKNGSLIVDNSNDEEIIEIKNSIDNIEEIEKSILTKEEIKEMLTKGNHLSLKKKLNEITDGKDKSFADSQKRYIVSVASEIGIDSSAKRKVICEWAGLDYENSDLLFDNEVKKMYDEK